MTLATPAAASGLDVDPVRVDLSAQGASAVVTVHNRSSAPVRCEVRISAWAQDVAGEIRLAPTRDVAVSPQALELGAGEGGTVRVSAATGPAPVEKAYRLVIEELPPPPAKQPAATHLPVLSRVGIPVFVAPTVTDERASIEALSVRRGRVRFSLWSRGTVHIRPSAVKVVALDAGGARVHEKSADTWYVLAGAERRYDLGIPAELCARVRSVRVEAVLRGEVLRAEAAVPQGACGG